MFDSISSAGMSMRRKPLAACLAAMFCLTAPAAAVAATTWTVNTCDETNVGSGTTGTLRYAAANAVSGDTIDLSTLACSTISLTTGGGGVVLLAQSDITLKGPGKDALSIDGNHQSRVLRHTGNGTLSVNNLTVSHGYFQASSGQSAYGGCILSNGSVSLSTARVRSCSAIAGGLGGRAKGGGIFATNDVALFKYSEVSDNILSTADTFDFTYGGGVFAQRDLAVGSSTISGNHAHFGGGARVFGSTIITASTISGNTAVRAGGVYARNLSTSKDNTFALVNSTISGNSANADIGGAWTNAGVVDIKNSTVAFNTAGAAKSGSRYYAAGFNVDDIGAYYTDINHYEFKVVTLQSSVFSNNVAGIGTAVADDVGITRFSNLNLVPVNGEKNLVFGNADPWLTLPASTVTLGVCPRLGPLRNNGGPTKTHALLAGSPAIDQGNNTVPFTSDQRGPPFARVSGAAADIGAYEVQQGGNDVVFSDGFDGPPTCP